MTGLQAITHTLDVKSEYEEVVQFLKNYSDLHCKQVEF